MSKTVQLYESEGVQRSFLPETLIQKNTVKDTRKESESHVPVEQLLIAHENKIRAEMESQLEQIRVKSYEEGVLKGINEGRALAEQELQSRLGSREESLDMLFSAMSNVASELNCFHRGVKEETRCELISIVFDAVCKIVGRYAVDEATIEEVIEPLLIELTNKQMVHLTLSPADFEFFHSEALSELRHKLGTKIVVSKQQGLEKLGLIAKSNDGELDLRLSTKLEQLSSLLIEHGRLQ